MIFLSLSTQILKQGPDPYFEQLSDRCIEAILKYHMNPEFRILNEVINHDLTQPANEYAQFSVIGHGIETLAFVMAEAVRRNDTDLLLKSAIEFRRHVEVAADKLYGGYFEVLLNADNYTWSPNKSVWCQQEILIGTLLMTEHMGDPWSRECFSELDAYVQEKMARPDFAFSPLGGDRKMEKPNTKIVEHYHTPRYLMRNMLALNRIMQNDGMVSGIIS
jgi:mannose/cellobiose epimerase-like protein (N-acyl-D-glucosamine 2-epimerase family)